MGGDLQVEVKNAMGELDEKHEKAMGKLEEKHEEGMGKLAESLREAIEGIEGFSLFVFCMLFLDASTLLLNTPTLKNRLQVACRSTSCRPSLNYCVSAAFDSRMLAEAQCSSSLEAVMPE